MNTSQQTVPDEPLTALLGEAAPQVVSLVGAGGKTSLLFALARLLVATGERVICTTTTKMFPPTPEQCAHTLLIGDAQGQDVLEDVRTLLREIPMLFLAHSRSERQRHRQGAPDGLKNEAGEAKYASQLEGVWGYEPHCREALQSSSALATASTSSPDEIKFQGLSTTQVMCLAGALPGVRFLVEADGASRRPLKAPAAHEPVVPLNTDCCIGVIGLDCLGRQMDAIVAHRLECVLTVTGQEVGSLITPETVRRLASHPEGLFRNCPSCRRVVFCNKAEVSAYSIPVFPVQEGLCWFTGSVREGWCRSLA